MGLTENFLNISKSISDKVIEKASGYISITPLGALSKAILIFISLLLIYLASIITKKGVKILLYVVGAIIILLVIINLIQNF